MTRGMVTIATGDKHYYEIAANLLLSYRFFQKNAGGGYTPFAIIAEEHNEYTELFDDVVITNESRHSFTDKFLLLKLCPYDENIFFDADCLAYGDLNKYWDFFSSATDFSILGVNMDLQDNNGAWYNIDGIGKYGDLIQYKSRVHAGVIFIRNSSKLLKMYEDCMELYENFDSLHFHTCPKSSDECIFGVAMPMNNMKAIHEDPAMIAAYPCLTKLKADLYRKKLAYSTPWHDYVNNGILLHWGTIQTRQPLYIYNVECLKYLISHKKTLLGYIKYSLKFRLFQLRINAIPGEIKTLYKRIKSRIQLKN